MRWVAKAAAQGTLGLLPAAESLNFLLQRYVTRNLPPREVVYRRRFKRTLDHVRAFSAHWEPTPLSEAVFYEFGAGWDLFIPLAFHSLGVERQVVTDVSPHARVELVNAALGWLTRQGSRLEERVGRPLRPVPARVEAIRDLEAQLGITYLAPRDARDTALPGESVDCVTSTATLEHIPEAEIAGIFEECRRLLRPGGLMSHRIDLRDHYAYFDRNISAYNFLRFSPPVWRVMNPALSYQNRLRYPDFLRLLRSTGFELVAEHPVRPGPDDLATLRALRIADCFRSYSLDDLGVKAIAVVARKTPGA